MCIEKCLHFKRKCRHHPHPILDILPVYLTRGISIAGGLLFRTSPFLRWEKLRCTQQAKSHNKKAAMTFSIITARTDVLIVSETHKNSDFINLLKKLNEKYPEGDIIRIVCDNHSAHKSKETTNFLATCPEGRFVLSRIFCMWCAQFLFLIYDDRHSFSPSAPNLFPIKYLCLVRS